MMSFSSTLWVAFASCQVASLVALHLGSRWAKTSRRLQDLGKRSYRKKLRALESVWPLTRLEGAVVRRDVRAGTRILAPLVLLKSALALLLGLVFLPWAPFASAVVPAIVGAHGAGDGAEISRWASTVARLQVTSHVAAAAVGFAATIHGPLAGRSFGEPLAAHPGSVIVLLAVSLLAGWAAARHEAEGIVRRDYLELRPRTGRPFPGREPRV